MTGHSEDRTKLLDAARRLVAGGDGNFSISALCRQAGVARDDFKTHFSGKAALTAALAQPVEKAPEAKAPEPRPAPEATQPDAWLERRLRVFERALTALEARTEAMARDQAQALVKLEERLMGRSLDAQPVAAKADGVAERPRLERKAIAETGPVLVSAPQPEAVVEAPLEVPAEASAETLEAVPEKPAAQVLPLEMPSETMPSREEMAEMLESARRAVRAATPAAVPRKHKSNARLRWLALGGLSLVVVFICAGLMLGDPARAVQMDSGNGVIHRQVASDSFGRMLARADNGDPKAQTLLALAYLKGEGVAADPRAAAHWSSLAAVNGQPQAQYLMGAMYHHGDGVPADAVKAFGWFQAAAAQGNVKAMHNLAIAYAGGLGTAKNPNKAADWFARAAMRGYVDSAFDLAVLYERGDGVAQDLGEALKWYEVAARQGDAPSKDRVEVLRQQLRPAQVEMASSAAQSFNVLTPPAGANTLPKF